MCVLTQLALGVSATLGLVFCVGDDHAGIELASEDCCAAHATAEPALPAVVATDCCSDIPLYAAARPLSDVRRSPAALTALVAILPVTSVGSASRLGGLERPTDTVDLLTRFTRRTIVLRI